MAARQANVQKGPSSVSGAGVQYIDGTVQYSSSDLGSGSLAWGANRGWSNDSTLVTRNTAGAGWLSMQQPYVVEHGRIGVPLPGTNGTPLLPKQYEVVLSPSMTAWFDRNGTNTSFVPKFGEKGTIKDSNETVNGKQEDMILYTDAQGQTYKFYGYNAGGSASTTAAIPAPQWNSLYQFTDRGGNTTTASYDSNGVLSTITQSVTVNSVTTVDTMEYTPVSGTVTTNASLIGKIVEKRQVGAGPNNKIREVGYDYYIDSDSGGDAGELKRVTIKDYIKSQGSPETLEQSYYRYYETGSNFPGGLKYALEGQDYADMVNAGLDPAAASDGVLAGYASNYYEYDTQHRVTLTTVQGSGCSSCTGGQGTYTYAYTDSANTPGFNSWAHKTVETLNDGNTNTVYTNAYGQIMLKAYTETASGNQWRDWYHYDSDGNQDRHATPAAVNGYSDANADLISYSGGTSTYLNNSAGLIEINEFSTSATTATTSTAGDVLGYLKTQSISNGDTGTAIKLRDFTYISQSTNTAYYPEASETTYDQTNGTGGRTTGFAYTWNGSATQMITRVVTLPSVSSGKNGPGSSATRTEYYDAYGRMTWEVDEEGYIAYHAYDEKTGALTQTIVDADPSLITYTGKPTRSGSLPAALKLTTSYTVDDLGRPKQMTDPRGNITDYVYNDGAHEVRAYRGFDGTNTTGPIELSRQDRPGNYSESLTLTIAPHLTSGVPDGTETFTASNIASLSRSYFNASNQLDHTDNYFSASGLTYSAATNLGTLGTNYLRTTYGYQSRGQTKRIQSPDGTIRWMLYDGLNRLTSTWTGTNDTSATNTDPTGGGAGGNNMVKVAENIYDAAGVGDSNLTESRAYNSTGTSAANFYATKYAYDFRDRMTDSRGADKVAMKYTLDNLGETTQSDTYADADTDFVIDSGELRGRSQASFDDLGRVYQSKVYNVDPTTGSTTVGTGQTGHSITTNSFYNKRGMAVKVLQPNGLFSKLEYDGAGRTVASYVGYDTGASESGTNTLAWSPAQNVTGDTIVQQVKTIYDQAGNAIVTTSYERYEADTSTTGPLGSDRGHQCRVHPDDGQLLRPRQPIDADHQLWPR